MKSHHKSLLSRLSKTAIGLYEQASDIYTKPLKKSCIVLTGCGFLLYSSSNGFSQTTFAQETASSLFDLSQSFSAEIRFPENSGIVDVTKAPYYADPRDSNHNDTQAIYQALKDHAGERKVIYLPSGVYNISEQIEFPEGPSGWKWAGNRLQGQSTDSTIIKLEDNADGFDNPRRPLAVIRTTGYTADWNVAQRFNNDISHLTIQTGEKNPGAIGLQFMSNNNGILEAVKVISEDGQGKYGVDFGFADENGPLLVKDLLIDGFEIGILTANTLNSQTFENISLVNQKQFGWKNQGQKVAVHNLNISNSDKEGIYSTNGNFVLVGGRFESEADDRAAINIRGGYAYLRDIKASGYQQALVSKTPNKGIEFNTIDEYVSHPVLKTSLESSSTSLNLPIENTPIITREAPSKWANIKDFGATETDDSSEDNDDETAIQQAINSGAATIYFPNQARDSYPLRPGSYEWGTVRVGGNVQHIIGAESEKSFAPPLGTFVIEDDGPPVVVFERLNGIKIINNTSRTVVVKNASANIEASGLGKTFLEDVLTGKTTSIKISDGHKLYARQLNPEWNGNAKPGDVPIIDNDGAQAWILGIKTETGGTIIRTRNGGQTEILGGHQYVIGTPETGNDNMFVVEDAAFSITSVETNFAGGKPYETYLRSTQDGTIREVNQGDVPYNGTGNAKAFPLLVSDYSTSSQANVSTHVSITPKDRSNQFSMLSLQTESFWVNMQHRLRQIR